MTGNVNNVSRFPRMYEVQDSITRLANATQYTAGDIISDHATVPTAGAYFTLDLKTTAQGYGSVTFTDFTLHKSDTDVTLASFAVFLFTTLPTLANLDDNAACAITDAEFKECKGVVPFAAADWTAAITGDIQTVNSTIGVVLGSASSIVYGVLMATAAYTPASGEIFTLTAHAIQD